MGALSTCDPGDIHETAAKLQKEGIRVSFIGLSAEMRICKAISQQTNGSYFVCMNEEHFKELVLLHSPPPPAQQKMEASLIRMGFPQRRVDMGVSLCVCHQAVKVGGYFCPQCLCKFCELPMDCQICSLMLISSSHLARSYHHLFPVSLYKEEKAMG
jgi:transcription initiation factor TFIIH subunit 2